MRLIYFIFITLLFLILIVKAIEIKIQVSEALNLTAYPFINLTKNVLFIGQELYNTGSLGYSARIRFDVFENEKLFFTGWSREEILMPGERKFFKIYWWAEKPGNYSGRLRIYYANEVKDFDQIKFQIKEVPKFQSIFEFKDFRTYEDWVRFSLVSNQSVKGVFVIPLNYPVSWVFEQAELSELEANKRISIRLDFSGIFYPRQLTLVAFTEDGKFATKQDFFMKKETGLIKYFHLFIDALKDFFNLP